MDRTYFTRLYVLKNDKTIGDFLDWYQKHWITIMREFKIEYTSVFISESKKSVILHYDVVGDTSGWDKKIETSPNMKIVMGNLKDIIDPTKTENYLFSTSRTIRLEEGD